jgi:acyl-CoA synthetase (AMP-forming)/AMP-acid ligase II/3-oxoacyl-(acyl-carrier-protein) synthase
MNVACWLAAHLAASGDHDAIIADGHVWTCAQVHNRATRLAGGLRDAGVAAGASVLLVLDNSADLVVGVFATLLCGAVAVPVPTAHSTDELDRIAQMCAAAALLTSSDVVTRLSPYLQSIRVRAVTGASPPPAAWQRLEQLADDSRPLAPCPRTPDDVAVICFTSGTTGPATAVSLTHGALAARHPSPRRGRARQVTLAALPLGGFGAWNLIEPLTLPVTLVLMRTFEPSAFVHLIRTHHVTTLMLVPTMARAVLALPGIARSDFASLRRVGIGGAHVPQELLERLESLIGVTPTVAYGMTEAGGGITATVTGGQPGSVGRPLPGVTIRITGEGGRQVASPQVGDVCVRTPWAGIRDEWLRTGDRGYLNDTGELFLIGRSTSVIIQGGINVHPDPIAAVLATLRGVADCAVVGAPHEVLGEQVVACVALAAGVRMDEHAIWRHCNTRVDRRKWPVRVLLLESLPRTPAGKVDEAALRAIASRTSETGDSPVMERLRKTPRAARLAALTKIVWRQVAALTHDGEAATDGGNRSFRDIGLDSLALAQLVSALSRELGGPIPVLLPFREPTVDTFCAAVLRELVTARTTRGPTRAASASAAALPAPEPIAIVAMACRFPGGADEPSRFWHTLTAGRDAIATITRWDMEAIYAVAAPHGQMATVSAAALFKELNMEADGDAPAAHRLARSLAHEAVAQAGWTTRGAWTRAAGIFLGLSTGTEVTRRRHGSTAAALSLMVTSLGIQGPAVAYDTTCSSSLFATHAAVQALRRRTCGVALVGGINVISSPRSFVGLSRLGVLAPDGRCKPFDASADGFGRGEGAVMLMLKRMSDAIADGDTVIAAILGTAARHDGRAASLAAPRMEAQTAVMRSALRDAGVDAGDVHYLEAHGAGTRVGDPVELEAAVRVYGTSERRLIVGSVKSNYGHCEAAAGVAGLLKTALTVREAVIPASLHCRCLTASDRVHSDQVEVPAQARPWPDVGRRRIAGVTSMGMSGTNVHVVLADHR